MHNQSFGLRLSVPLRLSFLAAAAFCCAALRLGAAEGAETRSALESDPQGWTDILPGADLSGWYRVPVPPGGKLGRARWRVRC